MTDSRSAVRAVMATALAGMGALHLVPPAARRMAAIVPPSMRDRPLTASQLVLLTGFCELAGAGGLLVPETRRAAGAALLVFYAAVFPANVYAARHPERFGPIAVPLVPRAIGQVAIAGLTVWAASGPRRP